MTRLASPDCLCENVVVLAIVVSELKLGNVQREILAADLVERAALAGDAKP
jgi:hypothetical protein